MQETEGLKIMLLFVSCRTHLLLIELVKPISRYREGKKNEKRPHQLIYCFVFCPHLGRQLFDKKPTMGREC